MKARHPWSLALFSVAVLVMPTIASAQFCYFGCDERRSCVILQNTPNHYIEECRYRCYQDGQCNCYYVECIRHEVIVTSSGTARYDGPCQVLTYDHTQWCTRAQCSDPTLADCDDVSEDNSGTPILIDVAGDGFHLTSAAGGVRFDLNANRSPETISWTEAGSDDAFLVFDRNQNGRIDDGSELFGNYTAQAASEARQGYRALALFDYDEDGFIDAHDGIWYVLRLWTDANHDGISQPEELGTLDGAGLAAIGVREERVDLHDRFGNAFRYRAPLRSAAQGRAGAWSYDVFLLGVHGNGRREPAAVSSEE